MFCTTSLELTTHGLGALNSKSVSSGRVSNEQASGRVNSANLTSADFKLAIAAFRLVMGEKTGFVDSEKDKKEVPPENVEEVESEPLSYAEVKSSSHRHDW